MIHFVIYFVILERSYSRPIGSLFRYSEGEFGSGLLCGQRVQHP